jgi:hypothetical protein
MIQKLAVCLLFFRLFLDINDEIMKLLHEHVISHIFCEQLHKYFFVHVCVFFS